MMHAPSLSNDAAATVIAACVASFCTDCGIPFSAEQVAASTVKAGALKAILEENGVETTYQLRQLMGHADLYLACDKGNSRKGVNSFVKYLAWWDASRGRVLKHALDFDVSGDDSEAAAKAVNKSLQKIDLPGHPRRLLSGQCTDAGGGGTGKSLYVSLKSYQRVAHDYLISTCSIHGWQRVLGNPITSCCGTGGLGKRDLLQMLHTIYQLEGEYEKDEFKGMWQLVSPLPCKTMVKPNIGRWGSVGEAAANLYERYDDWNELVHSIVASEKSTKNAHTLASYACSCLSDDELKAQLIFVHLYHILVFDRHFIWLQERDDTTSDAGFRSVNMPVHTYVMWRDLRELSLNWTTMNECKPYFDIVNDLANEKSRNIMKNVFGQTFFTIALNSFEDNFRQWNTDNVHLVLGGDCKAAAAFAAWLCNDELPEEECSYVSTTHQTTIRLDCLIKYITTQSKDAIKDRSFLCQASPCLSFSP